MEPSQGSGRHPWVKGQCGGRGSSPRRSSRRMLWAVCPALSSPPAHTARWVTAMSRVVRSRCHRVTPRGTAVLWLQAPSQLPAWPEPSLSLLEQLWGLAARFSSQQHRGDGLAYGRLLPPGRLRAANPGSVSLPRADRRPRGVSVPRGGGSGCAMAKAGLGSPPPARVPPLIPRRGLAEIGDCIAGWPPSLQPPLSPRGTGLGDNRSPCAGRGDLVQPSELSSGGIKGFAKTTRRSGNAGLGPGTSPRHRLNSLVRGCISPGSLMCPLPLLGAMGDTLGCPAAPASLPYAAKQLSRGSLAALPTVGRRLSLIKIVLGSI